MTLRRAELVGVLERSRALGFLGPGPVEAHIDHAEGFAAAYQMLSGPGAPGRFADIGSGGGVPALALAVLWPDSEVVLIDSMVRRTSALSEFVRALGLERRCRVITDRVEAVARTSLRGSFPLVTARSFGPPAVTAECGGPLVELGGWLIVSEPPLVDEGRGATDVDSEDSPRSAAPDFAREDRRAARNTSGLGVIADESEAVRRWPPFGLSVLGLAPACELLTPNRFVGLRKVAPTGEVYPRRSGLPAKRPSWK